MEGVTHPFSPHCLGFLTSLAVPSIDQKGRQSSNRAINIISQTQPLRGHFRIFIISEKSHTHHCSSKAIPSSAGCKCRMWGRPFPCAFPDGICHSLE